MFTAVALGAVLMSQQSIQPQEFTRKITKTVSAQYLVALPEGYEKERNKRWPLMLFLHGAGERGSDVTKVKVHGPLKEIENGRKLPFIVVAPQCPENEFWNLDVLTGLLDTVERKYRVDKDRVYLTGLSMGGYGTWALAAQSPDRFAAIAPVCGGGSRTMAWRLREMPTWVTHGDKDDAVPIQESITLVEAMKRSGGKPRFDIIVGGPHDVWTDFYAKDEFYDWLLQHKRRG